MSQPDPTLGFLAGLAAVTPTPRQQHRKAWCAKRRHQLGPRGAPAAQKLSPGFSGGRGTHLQRKKVEHQYQMTKERRRFIRSTHGEVCKVTGTRARGPRNSTPCVYVWEWLRQVTCDDSWKARSCTRAVHPPTNNMSQSPASARPEAMSWRNVKFYREYLSS